MTDIITFIDNEGKSSVYDGGDNHGIYRYLEIIGAPTTLTTSGHRSNHFGPSSSSNKYATTLQPVITALRMRQKSICECYEIIGHKDDACIIFVSNSSTAFTNKFLSHTESCNNWLESCCIIVARQRRAEMMRMMT